MVSWRDKLVWAMYAQFVLAAGSLIVWPNLFTFGLTVGSVSSFCLGMFVQARRTP